jgi:hypothetical protein
MRSAICFQRKSEHFFESKLVAAAIIKEGDMADNEKGTIPRTQRHQPADTGESVLGDGLLF